MCGRRKIEFWGESLIYGMDVIDKFMQVTHP